MMPNFKNRIVSFGKRLLSGERSAYVILYNRLIKWPIERVASLFDVSGVVLRRRIAVVKLLALRKPPCGILCLFESNDYANSGGPMLETREDVFRHYKASDEATRVSPHILFDTEYYIQQAGVVSSATPVEHYFHKGWKLGYSPSRFFDTDYYLEQHPEAHDCNPLVHYLTTGFKSFASPHRLFDPKFYLSQDKAKLEIRRDPLSNFLKYGERNGCDPHPLLNTQYIYQQLATGDKKEPSMSGFSELLKTNSMDKIKPSTFFDSRYYFLGLPAEQKIQPPTTANLVQHFLQSNPQKSDPNQDFSCARYVKRYPKIESQNPLTHYLIYGRHEGRKTDPSMPEFLSSDLRKQIQIEPTLLAPHQDASDPFVSVLPRQHEPGYHALSALVSAARGRAPDIIVLLPGLIIGGAEKIAAKLVHTLLDEMPRKNLFIILTDIQNMESQHWFPSSDRVSYVNMVQAEPGIVSMDAANVLARFVALVRPSLVINSNSQAGWEMYKHSGAALSSITRLAASLFCYDYDKSGVVCGYARDYIRDTIDYLDAVLIDNSKFREQLRQDFHLSCEQFAILHTVYQISEPTHGTSSSHHIKSTALEKRNRRSCIFWAARFCRQKQADILREVALASTDIDFLLWSPDSWDPELAKGKKPRNCHLVNTQSSFQSIVEKFKPDAFLVTSAWEGLPTTLLEATQASLPIITSDVGGIQEFIGDDHAGWLIAESRCVKSYVSAIRECLGDDQEARKRVANARRHLYAKHSHEAYVTTLKDIGLID